MSIQSVWHQYNLRESPFFQDQLQTSSDVLRPISLFVGRSDEAQRLTQGILSKRSTSSRQTVQAPPGFGKSTLVQEVKHRVSQHRILSHTDAIAVGHADSTEVILLRIVSYVYASILANAPTTVIADDESMVTAKQLTMAFQARSGGGSVSVGGFGVGVNTRTDFVKPQTAAGIQVPVLLQELASVAQNKLGADGILVHLNNLENLSESDEQKAAAMVRDIRDQVLMLPGLHWILVGTPEAIRSIVSTQRQLRSVFSLLRPLLPLSFGETKDLLHARYNHLRLDTRKPAGMPVSDEALGILTDIYAGDLRELLRALDTAAETLIEYGGSGGQPMQTEEIQDVLRSRFIENMEATLDPTDQETLMEIGQQFRDRIFTQEDVQAATGRSPGAISRQVRRLQDTGWIVPSGTADHEGRGRPKLQYRLSANARLSQPEL